MCKITKEILLNMNISPTLSLCKGSGEEDNGWRIWTEQCWKETRKHRRHVACWEMQLTDSYIQGSSQTRGWYHNCLTTLSLLGGSDASCFGRSLHWRLDYLRHTHEENGRKSLFSTQVLHGRHQWSLHLSKAPPCAVTQAITRPTGIISFLRTPDGRCCFT